MINDGIFDGLHSRCVIITNEDNKVIYTEQVEEIGQEPNYEKALEALKK
jgi:thiol peroxidase